MKSTHVWSTLLAVLLLATGACDDDPAGLEGPFDLTFTGDASFQAAHGGQTLRVAVISLETGTVVAADAVTVQESGDASFTVTFTGVLDEGEDYQIHYWIDSNFSETAAVDVCDGTDADHQWALQLTNVVSDVTIEDTHRPTETADVCATFAADLAFEGDASFQTPHGGQTIHAAVVRSDDGAVLVTQQGTVSETDVPSFSFTFPGALIYGNGYEIHYWIDSNFGGGTEGTCDGVENDHQWALDIGQPDEVQEVVTDTHRPGEVQEVCSTFQ